MTETPPKFKAKAYTCPFCQAYSAVNWTDLHGYTSGYFDIKEWIEVTEGTREQISFFASVCVSCKRFCLWRHNDLVWPVVIGATPAHADMPDTVRELYEEARQVLPYSRRAGAALARASLERLLKSVDKDAEPRLALDERIARVTDRVSTALSQKLTVLRYVGNNALHVPDEDPELVALYLDTDREAEAGIADVLFASINELVDELIAKPRQAAAMWSQLPEGVRLAAQRKAEAAGEALIP